MTEGTNIHPTAIVDKAAELGLGVKVGPYSIIGPKVVLGDEVQIDSHVVVDGRTWIGARTHIFPFASVGTEPQDLKYEGEDSELICGENNVIREYSNLSIGTVGGGGKTVVGSGNLFMVNTHVAHDCIVGDHCIFANGVSLGGHIEVGDRAVIGGHSALHQFVKIGHLAMLAGGSIVVQDVPPFCTVAGNHASPSGLNSIGLRRAGLEREHVKAIKSMYKILFQMSLSLEDAIAMMDAEIPTSDHKNIFLNFLRASKRGICR
ncbi:MAG: acyl-ACP--UDP-N-acetylglucosamine O-acyltransferase [Oligoflexales bacterium]